MGSRLSGSHEVIGRRVESWLAADEGRRVVLLLDEADALLESDAKMNFTTLSRFKHMMDDSERRFKVVFAGLHNVQRTSRAVNTPLAHLGDPVCIGPLLEGGEAREALALIRQPLEDIGYRFESDDLPMRILSHTNYYPSLIQLYCKHLLAHVSDGRRAGFDPRESPPYRLTSSHLEAVQSQELRAAISDRFKLTLNLDRRYRLIALCIALASSGDGAENALVTGVEPSWVRTEALGWWAQGFAEDRALDAFRTILDEMVGLGILRRVEGERYALRSPNLANLLGTRAEIESSLLDAASEEPPLPYEPASFRRSLGDDVWSRSPLSAQQESEILPSANGVSLIFGSKLGGLDAVPDFLEEANEAARFIRVEDETHAGGFAGVLKDAIGMDRDEGLTVLLVLDRCPWSEGWVERALDFVSRKTSKRRFARVVFLGDPRLAWQWAGISHRDRARFRAMGVGEFSLRPWSGSMLRRWMEEAGLAAGDRAAEEQIADVTGCWSLLLEELGKRCGGGPYRYRECLQALAAEAATRPDWQPAHGLDEEVLSVLRVFSAMAEPLGLDDIVTLDPSLSPQSVGRVFEWGELMALLRAEARGKFHLDPLVRRLLGTSVS